MIINKFRGDVGLFQPAIDFLERKTRVPVCGVVPHFEDLYIMDEDSVVMERKNYRAAEDGSRLEIAVLRIPRISNFTDFDPLESEPDVHLRYVGRDNPLGVPDMLIIPGSKNTIEDLIYLKQAGLAGEIVGLARKGVPVVGICGGFQMLGVELRDPEGAESGVESMSGLGLVDMKTVFARDKITTQVRAQVTGEGEFLGDYAGEVAGYEIHMGRTHLGPGVKNAFLIKQRSGLAVTLPDGGTAFGGNVWGTYIHGVFDDDGFRRHVINRLKRRKGLDVTEREPVTGALDRRQREYDRLARLVRNSLDMNLIYNLLGR